MDQECLIGWPESIKRPPNVCGYEFKVGPGYTFFFPVTLKYIVQERNKDTVGFI